MKRLEVGSSVRCHTAVCCYNWCTLRCLYSAAPAESAVLMCSVYCVVVVVGYKTEQHCYLPLNCVATLLLIPLLVLWRQSHRRSCLATLPSVGAVP